MSVSNSKKVVVGQPMAWIVLRWRGGWNAEPRVVRFTESEGAAMTGAFMPEMGGYDPPADETDVFTYHAVLACRFPMSMPRELR